MIRSFTASLLAVVAGACFAQAYPSKPVRVIVTSAAGSPPDIIMRGLQEPLRQEFGRPIVIENVPGGEGVIGAQMLMRAAPDGYNLLLASGAPITVNPAFQSNLPYDPLRDFAPVIMVAQFNSVFVVNASVPANSLKELIAMARAKPGAFTFGTGGTPTTANLYAEWLRHAMGVNFLNVPYKGTPYAMQGVLAGEVQVTVFAVGGAMAQAKAGKVKVLAAVSEKRIVGYPDIPTVAEEGVDIVVRNWYGLFARAGTPRDIVEHWNRAVSRFTAEPAFQEKVLFPQGMERAAPSGESPEVFAQFLQRDRALYQRIKIEGKLKLD
jgi:tripartite-type tricarboxylate transporter receptor subunit TctC